MNSTTETQSTTDTPEREPRGGMRRGHAPDGEGHGNRERGGPHTHRGRGGRRFGGHRQADLPAADDADAWFAGRLPGDLYAGAPRVTIDRDEIVLVGEIAAPELPADADQDTIQAAATGRIARFREQTREQRSALAAEAQARYGRTVAWGARIGETEVIFSNVAVPVMTRLRQDERRVLDTLVDTGVARSRSDALSWTVRLVGEHAGEWLTHLRQAMSEVDDLRNEGPQL